MNPKNRSLPHSSAFTLLFYTVLLGGGPLFGPNRAGAFELRSVTPVGEVGDARQIRATFSSAVVPFGDFRKQAGDVAAVACEGPEGVDLKGSAKWEDPETWVYDFPSELPNGVHCAIRWNSALRAIDGSAFANAGAPAEFHTGGAVPRMIFPYPGGEIDNEPVFIVQFDAKVDSTSLLSHLRIAVEGDRSEIEASIVPEGIARAVIRERGPWEWRRYWAREKKLTSSERAKERARLPYLVVVKPKLRLPDEKKVRLRFLPGLRAGVVASDVETAFEFTVSAPFEVTFRCERESADKPCVPIGSTGLQFSGGIRQVLWKRAKEIRLVVDGPNGRRIAPTSPRADVNDDEDVVSSVNFPGPLPELTSFHVVLPPGFVDESGNAPINRSAFPLAVATHSCPPLIKFAANFGVLEAGPNAALPVTIRNVESDLRPRGLRLGASTARARRIPPSEMVSWIGRIGQQDHYETKRRARSVLPAAGTSEAAAVTSYPLPRVSEKAFEVVGIPLPKPGFYIVEVDSPRLGDVLVGRGGRAFVSTAALVTNLGVHWKRGAGSNALVWVTALSTGKPVEGAKVSWIDCHDRAVAGGTTDSAGIFRLAQSPRAPTGCGDRDPLIVTAELGDDFSFARSGWNEGLEPWRFNVARSWNGAESAIAHTVFDRVLLRAGETVSMKHFLRDPALLGFRAPKDFPKRLSITHAGADGTGAGEKIEIPLTWRADGTAVSTWTIPKEAKLGTYVTRFVKTASKAKSVASAAAEEGSGESEGDGDPASSEGRTSGSFRVQEFRVPILKASLKMPDAPLVRAKEVPLQVQLSYLSGGPAAREKALVRYLKSDGAAPAFDDFEEFVFANGAVDVKARRDDGEDAEYSDPDSGSGSDTESGGFAGRKKPVQLDGAGSARVSLDGLATSDRVNALRVELEYRDPNGETQTSAQSATIYPARRLVGIKLDAWMSTREKFGYTLAVADLAGKPVRDAEVSSNLIERRTYTHRKKIVGGLYAYENRVEWKRGAPFCAGRTDARGLLRCAGTAPKGGNIFIEASTKDERGDVALANQSTWLNDGEGWWFDQGESDRIDLLPLKKRVEPGELAEFQVRMPFAKASALVTVERGGIIDSFVTEITREDPVIRVPIRDVYAPNVFVSAFVVRGRVGEPAPTAIVDLGKPAFRMGLADLQVGWARHRLKVTVTPERPTAKVREKLKVRLRVAPWEGTGPLSSPEFAVAVVDEGLLSLKPNDSWKLLEAMMSERLHGVDTSTNQMQVIGKRHFGLKALPTGGDGGRATTRELFSTLLYWNPRVRADRDGFAEVEIPVKDSLTSFRVAAIAHDGLERFGTGEGNFRSTQDLMIVSAVPVLARRGDRLNFGFTVRNASEAAIDAETDFRLSPLPKSGAVIDSIHVAPGESKLLSFPVRSPEGSGPGELKSTLTIRAPGAGGRVLDSISIPTALVDALPATTLQATLFQLEGTTPKKIEVEVPRDAVAGRSQLLVSGSASLLSGLDGMKEAMARYPYDCLEQRVSKAVALENRGAWDDAMTRLPSYLDGNGLVRYFPDPRGSGSEELNIYLLRMSDEMKWPIPPTSRERVLDGLLAFAEGKIVDPNARPGAAVGIRSLNRVAAYETLSRFRRVDPAVALALPFSVQITPVEGLIDWWQLLDRLGGSAPESLRRLSLAERSLRAKLIYRGTRVGLSESGSPWVMGSEDTATLRLLVLALGNAKAWKGDLGKMARGMLERQSKGTWWNTVANGWGTVAYRKFAATMEAEPVGGRTLIELRDANRALVRDGTAEWSWGDGKSRAATRGESNAVSVNGVGHPKTTFAWDDSGRELKLSHAGSGKPWITVQSRAAVPLRTPVQKGFRLEKKVSPLEVKDRGHPTVGDLYQVDLAIDADTEQAWVVIEDPIPSGSTILGSGLDNESALLRSKSASAADSVSGPTFEEKFSHLFRAYFESLPKGRTSLRFIYRLNAKGSGALPPTHAEAMYSPEIRGDLPNADWETR